MFAKTQLVFDPTSPADGDKVGAYVLGADGTAITHTGGSLDVNVTSAISVDVDHATDSVKIGDGTDFLAVNADGSINVVATATNFDIRDLAFATDKVDVSGSSVSISGNVNVTQGTSPWVVSSTDLDIRDLAFATDSVTAHQGGSWTVTANDAALANTAILNTQEDVTTTSAALLASQQANRKYLYVQNLGAKKCYIGASGVTTGTGIEMGPGTLAELRLGPAVSLHAVASSGTNDFRLMELS
jgi:hypothetical protein